MAPATHEYSNTILSQRSKLLDQHRLAHARLPAEPDESALAYFNITEKLVETVQEVFALEQPQRLR